MTKFTIGGTPQGKQRARVTKHGTYTPQKTKDYEKLVGWSYKAAGGKMMEGGVSLDVVAYFAIPKSRKDVEWGAYHLQKPDLDNVVKIYLDSLNGIAYEDDSQVCNIYAVKRWSYESRVEVTVRGIDG
jgi:Holliday junction resolvase RusA-like endonuclease